MTALATISRDFNGTPFVFREDGWFNMTKAAKHFGKRPVDFLRLPSTQEYIDALCAISSHKKPDDFFQVKHGRGSLPGVGTWAHPKLPVFFARWLDVRFAVMGDCLLLFRLSVIERIWPSLVCTIPFMKFTKENLGAFALGGMVIAVALSVGKKDLSDPRQVLCYKPDGGVAIDSIHDDGISYVGGATTWRSPDGVFHMSNLPCIAKRPPEPVSAGASESR
jgi:hypothetical protein